MALSHSIPSKPAITLKQQGWFRIVQFPILSLLFVLVFMNTANAGRFYTASKPFYVIFVGEGETAQVAADNYLVKYNLGYNQSRIVGSNTERSPRNLK